MSDATSTISNLSTVASFLNNTNSHIFFGTAASIDTFDDFVVNVFEPADPTPPEINVPDDFSVEATGPTGAIVTYTVSATDVGDGGPVDVDCNPASGTTFALGPTTVDCSASDSSENEATASFTVTVADTTAPDVSVPANIQVDAIFGSTTRAVQFTVTATDPQGVDPAPVITCSHASGFAFAIGTTTVTCSATDFSGNTSADASFTVTVRSVDQQVDALSAAVSGLTTVDGKTKLKLIGTLNDVKTFLAKSNARAAKKSARGKLGAFVNQVRALRNSRRISQADADVLTNAAIRISANLGN